MKYVMNRDGASRHCFSDARHADDDDDAADHFNCWPLLLLLALLSLTLLIAVVRLPNTNARYSTTQQPFISPEEYKKKKKNSVFPSQDLQ
jgi:hypothetical protein